MGLQEAYVPTQTNMETFEEDDILIELDEVEGEEVDIIDILSMISLLEKYQGLWK